MPVNSSLPSQVNFGVSPSNNYLVVAAGETAQAPIILTNQYDYPLLITPTIKGFQPADYTNTISLVEKPGLDPTSFTLQNKIASDSASNLIQTPSVIASTSANQIELNAIPTQSVIYPLNETFVLPAKTSLELELVVTPPLGQPQQEYYLEPLFTAQPAHENDPDNITTGSQQAAQIGSNLIVLVSDDHSDQSQLAFVLQKFPKFADSFTGYQIHFPAQNEGLTSTLAKGQITIISSDQTPITSYQFFPDLFLPQQTKDLRFISVQSLNATNPELTTSIPFFENQFLFGSYTIKAELGSAHHLNQNQPTTETFTIFFFPIYFTGALILGALILLAIFFIQKFGPKKKASSSATKKETTYPDHYTRDFPPVEPPQPATKPPLSAAPPPPEIKPIVK